VRARGWLPILVAAALALRLLRIGHESLWFDEAATYEATLVPWGEWLPWIVADSQFPLFHAIQKVFCGLFGRSETMLRLPSALFGTAAVAAIHGLGAELASRRAGLFAALLLALNPCAIFHAQDARPYSLLLLLALLSSRSALRLCRAPTRAGASAFVAATAGAFYTHPFGLLLLLPLGAMPLLLRQDPCDPSVRERPLLLIALVLLPLLLFLPWVGTLAAQIEARISGSGSGGWIRPATSGALVETWRRFFMRGGAETGALVALAVAIPLAAWRRPEERGRRLLLALHGAAFLLVPWVVSALLTPVFVPRYTLPALGAILLALAWALSRVRRPGLRAAAIAAFALLSARPLPDYYRALDKDPWRQTAALLRELTEPGDALLVDTHFAGVALRYYFRPPDGVRMAETGRRSPAPAWLPEARRVWHVTSYAPDSPSGVAARHAAASGRRKVRSILPGESLPRNPRLFHMAPIRLTLYQ
jgi:4-amino-4-deoxy-L-arabinose transferase-like glycosyltransferase